MGLAVLADESVVALRERNGDEHEDQPPDDKSNHAENTPDSGLGASGGQSQSDINLADLTVAEAPCKAAPATHPHAEDRFRTGREVLGAGGGIRTRTVLRVEDPKSG